MESDESWPFKDLAPEIRETAREAARRRGLSVGQWLQSVIVDSAAGPPREREPQRPRAEAGRGEAAASVTDKLDALSEQLARLERASAERPPLPASQVGGGSPELTSRLRAIEGNLSAIGKLAASSPPTQQLVEVLAGLNHRLDRLIGGELPPAQMPIYSGAANAPSLAFDEDGDLGGPPTDDWSTDLDQAIAEIVARQRALDDAAGAEPAPSFVAAPAVVPASVPSNLGDLHDRLGQLTDELRILRQPGGFTDTVLTLREELAQIGRTLEEAAPRRALQALETEVRTLVERVDERRQHDGDTAGLAGVEHGLVELREALRTIAPAETLARFRDDVQALDRKIEQIAAQGLEGVGLQPLQDKVAELRDIASRAASGEALIALAEEVQTLADKIDRVGRQPVGDDLLASLDQRFQQFAADLNARGPAAAAPVSDDLVPLIETLSQKISSLELKRENLPTLDAVMTQLMRLTERIEFSGERLDHLTKLERTFGVLLDRMDALRSETLSAAERVAREAAAHYVGGAASGSIDVGGLRHDLDALRDNHVQSDRRTQDTLEAVHDTLERLVDRLAAVETGLRREGGGHAPASRAAEPVRAPTIVPADSPRPEAPSTLSSPRSAAATERQPIDPSLPADYPLEPGDMRTRAPSAAERIAASEAALGPAKPASPAEAKSNFIAAARRAAQAAAAMSATPDGVPEPAKNEPSTLTTLAQKITRRRPLLLTGVTLLIGAGMLHVLLNGLGGDNTTTAGIGGKTAGTVETTGAIAAKKAATSAATAAVGTAANATKGAKPTDEPQPSPGTQAAPAAAASAPQTAATAPEPGKPSADDTADTAPAAKHPRDARTVPTVSPLTIATIGLPAGEVTGSLGRATGLVAPVRTATATPADGATLPAALKSAAAAGDPKAEYEVGTRYAEGRGVSLNMQEAARWFERAATRDLAPAQYRLGGLYEKGQGVKKDLDQARRLYRSAAEKGNGKAMHNLAVLYAEGVGSKPDFKAAGEWFRKAAQHGVTDSQFNLGILYARGLGVQQNLAESYKWFALAAKQGDKDAGRKRDEVAARMDQQAIVAAKLAVQTFVPEPQPPEAIAVEPPPGGWDAAPAGAPVPPARPGAASGTKGKAKPARSGAGKPLKLGT